MKDIISGLMFIPVMLAVFPIPLVLPIVLVGMCIDQPEETPLAIIYFSWLVASLIYFYFDDKKK